MLEFTVVAPLITLMGLAILQYGLLFFSRNQINHASFMAARAGSVTHARPGDIRQAYLRAMVPLYGGGTSTAELARAKARAVADLQGNLRIDLINPTRESFDDWSEPYLEQKYGARAIPNAGQAARDKRPGSRSGQSVQDANLIKIRVTHGYELKIPLVRGIYRHYLHWLDDGSDPFHTDLIARGRLPVIAQATLHMQSDAIESDATVSVASTDSGSGNASGSSTDGSASGSADGGTGAEGNGSGEGLGDDRPPPDCVTVGCSVVDPPGTPEGDGDGDGDGGGGGDDGSEAQGGSDGNEEGSGDGNGEAEGSGDGNGEGGGNGNGDANEQGGSECV